MLQTTDQEHLSSGSISKPRLLTMNGIHEPHECREPFRPAGKLVPRRFDGGVGCVLFCLSFAKFVVLSIV
jgi:hypothetical protein